MPPSPRPRRTRRIAIAALILLTLSFLFVRWATTMRQSGVRLHVHVQLRSIAQAAAVYEQQFNTPATLDTLLASNLLDRTTLREFSRCQSVTTPPPPPPLDAWLIQTTPCRAVRKGEAWGGPGETTDQDLPACRYVLMKDWTVQQIDEPDYQRDFAKHVRLTPIP